MTVDVTHHRIVQQLKWMIIFVKALSTLMAKLMMMIMLALLIGYD